MHNVAQVSFFFLEQNHALKSTLVNRSIKLFTYWTIFILHLHLLLHRRRILRCVYVYIRFSVKIVISCWRFWSAETTRSWQCVIYQRDCVKCIQIKTKDVVWIFNKAISNIYEFLATAEWCLYLYPLIWQIITYALHTLLYNHMCSYFSIFFFSHLEKQTKYLLIRLFTYCLKDG